MAESRRPSLVRRAVRALGPSKSRRSSSIPLPPCHTSPTWKRAEFVTPHGLFNTTTTTHVPDGSIWAGCRRSRPPATKTWRGERENAKSISEEVDDGRRHPLLFTREPQPSSSWSWMEGRSNWSQWRPSGDLGFTVVDFFLLLLSSYFANKLNVNKETESLGASSSVMSVYKRERRKRTWQHFPSENRVPIEEKRRETFDYKNIKKWMQKRHWWWRLRRCTTSADCVSPEFSFLLSLFSLIRLSSSVFYLFSLLLQSYRCCDRINTPSLLQTGGSSSSCTALNYCAVYQSHQFFSLPLLLPCLNPAAAHRSNISLSLFNIKRFVRTEEKIYIRKPNGGGRLPHDETGRTGAITPIGSIGCCCWIVHSATQFRLLSCTPSLQLARGEAVRASTGALRLIS